MQLTRVFGAPREKVFAAWKTPELLEQWSGCSDSTRVEVKMDFRVGGGFTQKLHIQGAGEHTIRGTYDEIIEPEKIVYHVNLGPATTRVTVEFIAQGNQTKVVLTQAGFPDENLIRIVSQGTHDSFDKLEEFLVGHAA
ncbi:MAG: SRPBCC family protein [Candidatus Acidiferrales bacterium]